MAFKRSRIAKGKQVTKRRRVKGSYSQRSNVRTGGYLGIENKFIDYTVSGSTIADTNTGAEQDPATANSISAIAQGDGESNRDGRKALINSVLIRGSVLLQGLGSVSTVQEPVVVRVALVLDQQTNGAQLDSEDVFLPATNVEHAFRNLQFTRRFRVLRDKTFVLNPQAAAGTGSVNDTSPVITAFNWFIGNLKIPVTFTDTTAVVANIMDNSLHVIAFTSSISAGLVLLNYQSRVRFTG